MLHGMFTELARKDPDLYVKTISDLKRQGDEIASLEGVTVGLEDITPVREKRDAILTPLSVAVFKEKDPLKQEKLIVEAQAKLLSHTSEHPGSMTFMARSGSRGNLAQLMKTVSSPLAATDPRGGVVPWVIRHSYSEGLSPSEYWATTPEARANNVATVVSVSKPGEMAKLLVANMINKTISSQDCGTHNGVSLPLDSPDVIDRHLAKDEEGLPRNTLITPQILSRLKAKHASHLTVRSPMTCSATHGVCQMCWGMNEQGKLHDVGTNVGVRSAQAMTEPLTQMSLSSKHAVLTIKERKLEPTGFKGVRQFLEVPEIFQHEAATSPVAGTVSKIEKAPQGGHFIHIGDHRIYSPPELEVTAHEGLRVEAGDSLSAGVPSPAKIVALKGLGAGRNYYVGALHKVYEDTGNRLDRRHFELLAKSTLNHVRFVDHDPHHPEFLKGDLVNYNTFRDAYAKDTQKKSLKDALGEPLGEEIFHHTVGTLITPSVVRDLASKGIKEVAIAKHLPHIEPVMKSFVMNPLLDEDWMGRLAHRYLRDTIMGAAHMGETADIHGPHPVTAYAYGTEFRHGPGGTY